MLEDLDDETRAQIDVQNPMRVARAWEVLQATGQSIRSWQARTPPPLLPPGGLSRAAFNQPGGLAQRQAEATLRYYDRRGRPRRRRAAI